MAKGKTKVSLTKIIFDPRIHPTKKNEKQKPTNLPPLAVVSNNASWRAARTVQDLPLHKNNLTHESETGVPGAIRKPRTGHP